MRRIGTGIAVALLLAGLVAAGPAGRSTGSMGGGVAAGQAHVQVAGIRWARPRTMETAGTRWRRVADLDARLVDL